MFFKWRDVQGLKVYTNYDTQNRIEEDKKHMKCFKENDYFITGTYTTKNPLASKSSQTSLVSLLRFTIKFEKRKTKE